MSNAIRRSGALALAVSTAMLIGAGWDGGAQARSPSLFERLGFAPHAERGRVKRSRAAKGRTPPRAKPAATPAPAPIAREAPPEEAARPARVLPADPSRPDQEWARVLAALPLPDEPLPLPPLGPAPAAPSVLALYAPQPAAPLSDAAALARAPVPLPPRRQDPDRADDSPDAPSSGAVPLPLRRPADMEAALPPSVPLPPMDQKPDEPTPPDIPFPELSYQDDPDCRALEEEGTAIVKPMPPIAGPGVCGVPAPVELTGVRRSDGSTVAVKPAAILRCAMARAVAAYVRDDLAPAIEAEGAQLDRLDVAGSFACRGRNGAAGGKMSEHGRADALDVGGFTLKDGRSFGIFADELPQKLADATRSTACARFNTVLGPGADGHHENHLHLDLQPRRSKTKLCQWNDDAAAAAEDGAGERGLQPEAEPAAARPKAAGKHRKETRRSAPRTDAETP